MTKEKIRVTKKSAFSPLILTILIVIALLLIPASAFASGDDCPGIESSPTTAQETQTDQSGGFEGSTPTVQFESPADHEQDTTANFAEGLAYADPGSDNPDTGNSETDSSNDVDTASGEQELAPPEAGVSDADDSTGINDNPALETPSSSSQPDEQSEPAEVKASSETGTGSEGETDDPGDNGPNNGQDLPSLETEGSPVGDTVAGEANSTATAYFMVQEVSMSPLLNPGSIIEVTSATYADGDMVVAQKSDGTYIVKMLDGDQLVPLGAGTSYSVADVTILGAAHLSSMTAEDLELSGMTWCTVLAQTATQPSGDGTAGNPYLIATLENLYWITNNPDKWGEDLYYLQTANIDANATSTWFEVTEEINGEDITYFKGWLPIGSSLAFYGKYDGNDYTISNLYINRPLENKIGLLAFTGSSAVLQNIRLENVDITGNQYVGGLVGLNNGTINNCNVSGEVKGYEYVGGLVGKDEGGTTSNSYSTAKVTGNGSHIGGLVGYNRDGTITNSCATGKVEGYNNVGGLVGTNYGMIENCYAKGNVTGINDIGGLVGENNEDINYCYATGIVNGKSYVGGLVGQYYDGDIGNCYATGTVNGEDYVGGLIGDVDDDDVNSCYATGNVNGNSGVGGLIGYNNGCIYDSYAAGIVNGISYVGGLVGDNPGYVENSYWNSEINGSLPGIGDGTVYDTTGKTTAEIQTINFHLNTLSWDITGQDGSYPVLGWQVDWEDNIWYMGTPPTPDNTNGGSFGGDFGFFDFEFPEGAALLAQNGSGLTTITGQGNAPITPGIIASGSWNDLNQAVAAYQAALASLENNRTTLSPAELALLEVELAIARAAILALEAKLLAADGLPFNLAALQAAYAVAVATVTANQSFLSAGQLAAANQLLTTIASAIAALQ